MPLSLGEGRGNQPANVGTHLIDFQFFWGLKVISAAGQNTQLFEVTLRPVPINPEEVECLLIEKY
jgi:hypothetical protein